MKKYETCGVQWTRSFPGNRRSMLASRCTLRFKNFVASWKRTSRRNTRRCCIEYRGRRSIQVLTSFFRPD